MIRINFCRTGASVSDWDIADKVEFFKSIIISRRRYIPQDPCPIYDFSNFLLFDAFRAEIAEDKIALDEICFSYEDEPIEVNEYGKYDKILRRQEDNLNFVTRMLIAASEKWEQKSLKNRQYLGS